MQPATSTIERPQPTEYDAYYERYTSLVPDGNVVELLASQIAETTTLLSGISEQQAGQSYEPGKWTIKQVVGHMADTERIFAYRMLRIGRNDSRPIEGFDQDPYVVYGPFAACSLHSLVDELRTVRESTLHLLRHFGPEAWIRRGTANGREITVRALAYLTAGHELHHRRILKDRYLQINSAPGPTRAE